MNQEQIKPIEQEKNFSATAKEGSQITEKELADAEALKNKLDAWGKKDAVGSLDEIGIFANRLRNKHPDDYQDYLMYHVLAGSGYECSKFDFSGEDSVRKFIDEMHEKYLKSQAL